MFQLSLTERQKEIGIMLLALIHSNIGIDIHQPLASIKIQAKKNSSKSWQDMFQLSLTERQKEIGIMLLALIHSNIGIDIHSSSTLIKI